MARRQRQRCIRDSLYTYWIAPVDAPPPDPALLNGQGSLDVLAELVTGGWLERLGRAT